MILFLILQGVIMCDCVHAHMFLCQKIFCRTSIFFVGARGVLWCPILLELPFSTLSSPTPYSSGLPPPCPLNSLGYLKLLSSQNFRFTMLTHLANLLRRIFRQWSCISLTNLVKLQHAESLSKRPSSDSTDNCSTAQFHWPLSTNCWIWQLCKRNVHLFIKNNNNVGNDEQK